MRVTADTNVLARALVDDPGAPGQCESARKALTAATVVIVPQVVQIELCWLLESAFGLRHAEVVEVLRVLRANPRIELENRAAFDSTFERFASDPAWSFADCLIATIAASKDTTLLTFDKKLAHLAGQPVLR